jgi:hypothetical protein
VIEEKDGGAKEKISFSIAAPSGFIMMAERENHG